MAICYSSISYSATALSTTECNFEVRLRSPVANFSSVSFKNRKAGLRGARASFATDVWSALSSSVNPGSREVGYLRLDRFNERKRCGASAAVPVDVVTVEDNTEVENSSEEALISNLLTLVKDGDRGVALSQDQQDNVGDLVHRLEKFGIDEPLQSPLVFGEWDVAYASNPTSPGGPYRTWLGRLIFKTREMIQTLISPDVVVNVVRFAFLGLIAGEVILRGKLLVLEKKLVQVNFEPPTIQVGPFKFVYGKESKVKLSIVYLNETVRLGRGARGTIFVFTRRPIVATEP